MATHHVTLKIPPSAAQNGHGEVFARRLVTTLMPDMARSFGPIEDNGKVVWTAHDWQEDGTFVHVCVDPDKQEIQLHVQTNGIERPKPPITCWTKTLMALFFIVAVAVGLWLHSVLGGLFMLVLGFGIWIGFDIVLQIRAERKRKIDPVWWNDHLGRCIRDAE